MPHETGAEGWYVDPYALHDHRWFSAGTPTSLVRDHGVESTDDPPGEPFERPLVEAGGAPSEDSDGSDLRRVGDGTGDTYDPDRASDAAFDASTWFPTA